MSNRITLMVESEIRGTFDASVLVGDSVNTDPMMFKSAVEKLWVKISEEMHTEAGHEAAVTAGKVSDHMPTPHDRRA